MEYVLRTKGLTVLSSKFGPLEEESSEAHRSISSFGVDPAISLGHSFTIDYLAFETLVTGF